MRVNGEERALSGARTLKAFLEREGYEPEKVAVEKNGLIVPKAAFDREPLTENDRLEIVSFVGGG